MKYLLDTNICIYIINQRPAEVIQRFRQYAVGDIGISSITASELAYGVEKSASSRNKNALSLFLAPLSILPFDENCIWQYGQLRSELERKGNIIGPLDQLIAAHALSLNIPLVTNNLKEFKRIPNLQLENWVNQPNQ